MAAPNLGSAANAYGKTAVLAVTTSASAIVTTASNHLIKVISLTVANVNGTATADVTIDHYRSSAATRLAYLVTIPPKTSVPFLGKDIPLYLEEGDALRLTASVNLYLEAVVSYEDVS